MTNLWMKLRQDARGATAVEYGLIVALIVIVVAVGISGLGSATGSMWGNIAAKVSLATPSA